MRILAVLSHPAHYYLFKFMVIELRKKGHEAFYAIRNKDILEAILIAENVKYKKLCKEFKRGNNKFSILLDATREMLVQDMNLLAYSKSWKPDILIGTDISISHIGKLFRIPSIVFNEDDYEINKLFCISTYPFATHIVSPHNCNVGPYKYKKIGYDGYQKLAYLHPNYYQPDISVLEHLNIVKKKYFLIRLVSLTAVHDMENEGKGINSQILSAIIEKLKGRGQILITSEKGLSEEFKKYELKIEPNAIHHLMSNACLFIGDSQSMCVEAAMLGVPSIRFNSFVGKITVLEELEHHYKLTFGIKSNDSSKLFSKLDELLLQNDLAEIFQQRRIKMLNDKIDLTSLCVWLIENYPKSIEEYKNNPEIQYWFK